MNIDQLQEALGQYILNQADNTELQKHFPHYSEEEFEARLSIYKNNYYASLIEAMEASFETVYKLVGEDFFKALCKAYLQAHPPQNPIVILLGENFPGFITSFPHTQQIPYLADVAKLDWARQVCHHAPSQASVEPSIFSRLSPTELMEKIITPRADIQLIRSAFPIYSIWEMNHSAQSPHKEIDLGQSQQLLLIRNDEAVEMYCTDLTFFNLLKKLANQISLGEALENAMEENEAFNASEAVSFIIQTGFIYQLQ